MSPLPDAPAAARFGRDVCVIANPTAGSGAAAARLRRLRTLLRACADFRQTRERGHAIELSAAAAKEGYPIIAAAGGDGTVHEVANGLILSGREDVTLAVLPLGSANDYAHGLGLAADWWERRDAAVRAAPVDVGRVRAGNGRQEHFVNNLGIGLTGAVALEAEGVPLRGLARYMIGLMRTLCFRFDRPPMTVTLDGISCREPTLALSLGIGTREGSFQLVPQALLDDGLFDYVHVTGLTRRGLVKLIPAGVGGRLPTDHPCLRIGRCRVGVVESESPLVAHADGEFVCRPVEGVHRLEVETLPGRLRVLRRCEQH